MLSLQRTEGVKQRHLTLIIYHHRRACFRGKRTALTLPPRTYCTRGRVCGRGAATAPPRVTARRQINTQQGTTLAPCGTFAIPLFSVRHLTLSSWLNVPNLIHHPQNGCAALDGGSPHQASIFSPNSLLTRYLRRIGENGALAYTLPYRLCHVVLDT